ncbi:MAG TPA: type IIL restriction-modification enzyme MmeI [Alphaproteobacteria bacterium]|nr:type IIL restriction-modification enzyme MmeI [Alphaproteobacteria bacterium]
MITTQEFIEKWRRVTLSESSASREHFLDLCDLLEVDRPAKADPTGKSFTFEKSVKKLDGRTGRADVWKKNCFAWEYKGKQASLIKAYSQLKEYADALENPPLLIVSDMKEIRIHTNFTNSVVQTRIIQLADLRSPENIRLLRSAFENPEYLRPNKSRESVTADAARALASISQALQQRKYEPRRVAHLLNKFVFSMFVEDENIGLLPDRLFAEIVEEALRQPDSYFGDTLRDLFGAMRSDKDRFGKTTIPWFNGGLFDDDDVLPLTSIEIRALMQATRLGSRSISRGQGKLGTSIAA